MRPPRSPCLRSPRAASHRKDRKACARFSPSASPRGQSRRRVLRRILIANRGEIAIRIERACQELGVETVAVYSEIDAGSPHVRLADRAVAIGPSPAAQSYLNVERIVGAARATGADAVHPGYGFLSENAAFARACADAGLTFIGPTAGAIEKMGSKIESRRLVAAAGVPIVPGETPTDQS